MKMYRFLLAFIVILPLLQACTQADVADTGDPRDAIAKKWRVTDNNSPAGQAGYDVTITKDATEQTQVLFQNFHGLGTADKLKATLAGNSLNVANQTLDGTYTILNCSGTISSDGSKITFTYKVDDGDGASALITANFGAVITVKKKAEAKNPL